MKKKLTFLIVFICMAFLKSQAQKNVVKINLPSLAVRNLYFSYERALSDKKSFTIAIAFMPPSRSKLFSSMVSSDNSSSGGKDISFDNIRLSGFSITPEFRFYTARRKEAPRGFYVAPYLRYQNISLKGDYTQTYNNSQYPESQYPNGHTAHFTGKGSYSVTAVGVQLGYQWLIADRVSIDWSFFGLGIGNYKLKITESSNDAGATYFSDNKVDLNNFPGRVSSTSNSTSRSASVSTFFPHLRSGLSIGYAF